MKLSSLSSPVSLYNTDDTSELLIPPAFMEDRCQTYWSVVLTFSRVDAGVSPSVDINTTFQCIPRRLVLHDCYFVFTYIDYTRIKLMCSAYILYIYVFSNILKVTHAYILSV